MYRICKEPFADTVVVNNIVLRELETAILESITKWD